MNRMRTAGALLLALLLSVQTGAWQVLHAPCTMGPEPMVCHAAAGEVGLRLEAVCCCGVMTCADGLEVAPPVEAVLGMPFAALAPVVLAAPLPGPAFDLSSPRLRDRLPPGSPRPLFALHCSYLN